MSNSLYDRDFYAWANEQAALLRAGRLSEADIENIAEEIESMGRSEKRELVSRLTVLLLNFLKWQFQPNFRSNSWRLSIEEQRFNVDEHLNENSSLRGQIEPAMRTAYRGALIAAQRETGLASSAFSSEYPYSLDQAMNAAY